MATTWQRRALLVAWVTFTASGAAQALTTYTSEAEFLSATGDATVAVESFEDEVAWGGVRSTVAGDTGSAESIRSNGVAWRANHPDNRITTGSGAARTGGWGLYSVPHGDLSVRPTDFIHDGVAGSSPTPMTAVGGWFKGTPGSELAVVLDGGGQISLGPVGTSFQFYGVVAPERPFTSFAFRETEGTLEDQKLVFVDDVMLALAAVPDVPMMDGAVVGVANSPGALGSDWHTDLYLHNASAGPVLVELRLATVDGVVGAPAALTLAAGSTEQLQDVVATLFGFSGSGSVLWRVLSGEAAALLVTATTYNRVDAVRRYGQQLPGIRCADAVPAGGEGRVVGFTVDDRTRSNLILQNACADTAGDLAPATVTVTVLGGTGVSLGGRSYALQPGEYRQHNRFLADYGADVLAGGSLRVEVTDPAAVCTAGGVLAMVSEVNGAALQGTNDARLVRAIVIERQQ